MQAAGSGLDLVSLATWSPSEPGVHRDLGDWCPGCYRARQSREPDLGDRRSRRKGHRNANCSFTWISSSSQSLTCTQRPATQVWNLQVYCYHLLQRYPQGGNQVTGEGTSTVSNCTGLNDGSFYTVS